MLAPRRKGRPCRNQINSIPKKNKNKKTFSLAKKRDRIRDGISERNLDDALKKCRFGSDFSLSIREIRGEEKEGWGPSREQRPTDCLLKPALKKRRVRRSLEVRFLFGGVEIERAKAGEEACPQ